MVAGLRIGGLDVVEHEGGMRRFDSRGDPDLSCRPSRLFSAFATRLLLCGGKTANGGQIGPIARVKNAEKTTNSRDMGQNLLS